MSEAALELRDVRGPSALGGGWRRALDLLYLIAVTEFKRTYFGTALGYLWSLARPLMLFAVLLAVFTQAFDLGDRVPHYPVLLLFNIVLFSFFQEATTQAVELDRQPGGGGAQDAVPAARDPARGRADERCSTSALNLVVVFVLPARLRRSTPMWTWLLASRSCSRALIVLTTAVAMIVSALYPRFRDIGDHLDASLATALFYATPVLYPLEIVPETLRDMLALNPLAPLFELARKWVIDPDAPGRSRRRAARPLLIPVAIFVGTCVLAVWVFRREAPRIAEEL